MGRIKKGILGGFSGKVGTVVGANWKQVSYIRSLPQNVKNPRTEAQRKQRSKFLLVLNLLKPLNPLLRIGWKLYAKRQSAFNAATSYVLANAIQGTFPNFEINYQKVLISRGALAPATNATATATGTRIQFSWDNNIPADSSLNRDKALIAVLNPAKGIAITQIEVVERTQGTFGFDLPTNWQGDRVEPYLGFISEDGKEISNSVYAGQVLLA